MIIFFLNNVSDIFIWFSQPLTFNFCLVFIYKSWKSFSKLYSLLYILVKGPNYATIKDANIVLESLFQRFNLDIDEHVSSSALATPESGNTATTNSTKKKSSKKRRVESLDDTEDEEITEYDNNGNNVEYAEEEDEEFIEDWEISDDDDDSIEHENALNNNDDIEFQPSAYEILREKNIEEIARMRKLAGL